MNIIWIISKEFKHNLRDYKSNLMMVLFPIVLIVILGAAFSNVFNNSTIKLSNVTVLYTQDVDGSAESAFAKAFEGFRNGLSDELAITFEKTDDVDFGIESMNYFRYSAYIHVLGNPPDIKLYKNERQGFAANLLEGALNSFINTYGAMSTIAENNPAALAKPGMQQLNNDDYVNVKALDQKKQPGSLDYYAVSMMSLIIMYASLTGLWGVRNDINRKTGDRILCAPVRPYELLTGKVIGSIIVTAVQALVVVLFSGLILKANWGDDPVILALLLLAHSIMAVSMGVGLAYLFKNDGSANGVLNTIIPFFVFLGGGYVPISEMGSTLVKLSSISPVKWVNSALFKVIYDGDYSHVPISIGINLGIATIFILIAVLFSKKGAGNHA